MLLKIFIVIPVLYFLTLIQSSFLPHFAIFGPVPNLVLISIVFLFFFLSAGRQGAFLSLIFAFVGGVFLDAFSSHFFGFYVLIALGIFIFIRQILKRYVQVPIR